MPICKIPDLTVRNFIKVSDLFVRKGKIKSWFGINTVNSCTKYNGLLVFWNIIGPTIYNIFFLLKSRWYNRHLWLNSVDNHEMLTWFKKNTTNYNRIEIVKIKNQVVWFFFKEIRYSSHHWLRWRWSFGSETARRSLSRWRIGYTTPRP